MALPLLFLCLLWPLSCARAQTRPAAVAGSFYPADPKELAKVVDDLVGHAPPPAIEGTVQTLVEPHAGYEFSGGVAAHGYALVKGKQ